MGNITFGVSDTGNTTALCMCLASVLNARVVPHKIQVLCQGEFPDFAHYYLEQLSEWARMSGIEWSLSVTPPLGLRGARDWHLDNCRTQYLWMGDNDVVYGPECLEMLCFGLDEELNGKQAYVQGVKTDLNNRRGYKDFVKDCLPRTSIVDFCSANMRYDQLTDSELYAIRFGNLKPITTDIVTIDTGNVLLNVDLMNTHKLRFKVFDDSINCGGEDTLMALLMRKKGLVGRFMPWAYSFHLEKPKPAFDELTARGEMLLRACDQLGLDKDLLKKGFAPWCFEEAKEWRINLMHAQAQQTHAMIEKYGRCNYQEPGNAADSEPTRRCYLWNGHECPHDLS